MSPRWDKTEEKEKAAPHSYLVREAAAVLGRDLTDEEVESLEMLFKVIGKHFARVTPDAE
jgi:hypothetical protein